MSTITFDFTEIVAAGRALADVTADVEHELQLAMAGAMRRAEGRARTGARIDTGDNLRKTKGTAERIPGGVRGLIGTSAQHGPTMEFGRRPGARMPPAGVLLGWMRRRGIPDRAEFPLRRAIGRRGIKADHNLERARDGAVPDFAHDVAGIGPRVVNRALKDRRS